MKKSIITLSILVISWMCFAQNDTSTTVKHVIPSPPIQIEVMGGHKASSNQVVMFRPVQKGSKFNVFNLVNYEVDDDEFTPNTYVIQTIGFYSLHKKIALGTGAKITTFGGFQPVVSGMFSHFTKNIGVIIQPSVDLKKNGVIENFALFEFRPVGDKKIQPYFRLQTVTSWGQGEHKYSYHNWRLGVQYKMFRVGPAVNVQYYGEGLAISETNVGGFVGILIE